MTEEEAYKLKRLLEFKVPVKMTIEMTSIACSRCKYVDECKPTCDKAHNSNWYLMVYK